MLKYQGDIVIVRFIHVVIYVSFFENIDLILAFIIDIISQPIEHLNISLVFILCSNTEMQVTP